MSEAEYIALLWRIIYAFGGVIAVLCGVIWDHFRRDRKTRRELADPRVDLQRCKDRLGINGISER